MKRYLCMILSMILCVLLFFLAACGMYSAEELNDARHESYDEGYDDGLYAGEDRGRERGYDDGYSDGHSDGHSEGYDAGYEEGRWDGYDEGYRDGINEAKDMETLATDYAMDYGGMHPEEAMCVIYDFENQTTEYNDTIPTVDDYLTAVHSLYCFYEYFYSN